MLLRRDRVRWARSISCIVVVTGLVTIAALPFAHVFVGIIPTFYHIYGTALVLMVLASGAMFAMRAAIEASRPLTILAAGCAFVLPLVIAWLCAIPGAVTAGGAYPLQAAAIASLLSHMAWPVTIIAYTLASDGPSYDKRRTVFSLMLASLLIVAVLAAFNGRFPVLVNEPVRSPLLAGVEIVTFTLDVLAVALLFRRPFSWRDLWLAGAAICVGGYELLQFTSSIASVATYVARFFELASAACLLLSLVSDYAHVLVQAGRESEARRSLARERRVANALQQAFNPTTPPSIEGARIDALYQPADAAHAVGGDWLDPFVLRDGLLAISIGDVTGHGVDAAAAMVRLREAFRTGAMLVPGGDAAEIMRFVNGVALAGRPPILATALFAVLDPRNGRLTFASAGHPLPIIARGREAHLVGRTDIPLGVDADATFTTETASLAELDAVLLYTDGLIESTRDAVRGEREVIAALAAGERDPAALLRRVIPGASSDDVALAIVTYLGLPAVAARSWKLSASDALAAQGARESLRTFLAERAFAPGPIAVTESVFGELVANVVRHAPGPIDVELLIGDDATTLAVRDRGPGFAYRGPAQADLWSESGRGLSIVTALAGEPTVNTRPGGGCEVTVRFNGRH